MNPRRSDALFWSLQIPNIYMVHRHTQAQNLKLPVLRDVPKFSCFYLFRWETMGIWSDTKAVTQVLIETTAVCSKLQGLRAQTTSCTTIRCLTSLFSTCKTGVGYHHCLICSYDVTLNVVIRETSTAAITQSGSKHARVGQSSLLALSVRT